MSILSRLKKITGFNRPKIIIICGPTATGKTSLSIEIAKKYHGEIISADSRQIYRGLDIGSAKVTVQEMQGIPHHMIDIADPKHRFTVQEFTQQSRSIIKEIITRGNTPIICGGTGMYIDALVFNQSFPEVQPNPTLRAELEQQTTAALFEQLKHLDPQRAATIDRHNKVRLIRALEIINSLGTVPKQKTSSPYQTLLIGLDLDKEQLNKRIHQRIIDRLENENMLKEAINLHKNGLSHVRMQELGLEYRYMSYYLQNKIPYEDMINELTTKTIQFAKRQRTWFKRNKQIHWFNPQNDQGKILEQVDSFLKK